MPPLGVAQILGESSHLRKLGFRVNLHTSNDSIKKKKTS
jgi:hypothetical protein